MESKAIAAKIVARRSEVFQLNKQLLDARPSERDSLNARLSRAIEAIECLEQSHTDALKKIRVYSRDGYWRDQSAPF